ncbi:MAG: TIGR03560 family F420-dependent LLM class oxidoreductase [Anaerolineae bacterium]|jgi:F420-dependent oxidoreductase-like protein|nr:TIGR03560 family F420-dependent LLM class oxidoreductase [Anaerolineae bacterium]
MDRNIMIEAQAGVYWPEWQRLARTVEDLGFDGLYRSDHFPHGSPPTQAALELWVSLTWLAANTRRIAFGPLVSPTAFRSPAMTAWMALQVDDLSGGRLRLGLGAGWHEGEHRAFGFPLLDVGPRFERFREALEVVTHLLRSDEPVSFHGATYTLDNALLLPRPARPGGPPITIGGNGRQRTLPLVAKYADEWNAVWRAPTEWRALNVRLDGLLVAAGRRPSAVRRTMMTGIFFGRTDAELREILARRGQTAEALRAMGAVVGTAAAVRDQLAELGAMGLDGVMLQWLDLDDWDRLEALAKAVL